MLAAEIRVDDGVRQQEGAAPVFRLLEAPWQGKEEEGGER